MRWLRQFNDWLCSVIVGSVVLIFHWFTRLCSRRTKEAAVGSRGPSQRSSTTSLLSPRSSSPSLSSSPPKRAPTLQLNSPRPSTVSWTNTGWIEEESIAVGKDLLNEVRRQFLEYRDQVALSSYPEVGQDPVLCPDPPEFLDAFLLRFIRAEMNVKSTDVVETAMRRLTRAVEFRRDYRVLDMHKPAMAHRLFMHASNAEAAMYFADIGLVDKEGEPVLVGRLNLIKGAPVEPGNHLRAAIMVIERCATLLVPPRRKASYILDLSPVQIKEARFWLDAGPSTSESIGPHLPKHESLDPGLPVLQEAMRLMSEFYPEFLKRVYFYKAPAWFKLLFNVFRLWADKVTREKFGFVNGGDENIFLEKIHAQDLPLEFGGKGTPLDGDDYMRRAIVRYDNMAVASRARVCSPYSTTLPTLIGRSPSSLYSHPGLTSISTSSLPSTEVSPARPTASKTRTALWFRKLRHEALQGQYVGDPTTASPQRVLTMEESESEDISRQSSRHSDAMDHHQGNDPVWEVMSFGHNRTSSPPPPVQTPSSAEGFATTSMATSSSFSSSSSSSISPTSSSKATALRKLRKATARATGVRHFFSKE